MIISWVRDRKWKSRQGFSFLDIISRYILAEIALRKQSVAVVSCTFLFLTPSYGEGKGFKAAVVKVDVTPQTPQKLIGYGPRVSTGVHDRIYHRILAMHDGENQAFIISSDFCLFSPSVYESVTSVLQREHGIDPVQVWWSVTHTHSAPQVGPGGMAEAFHGARYEKGDDPAYTTLVKKSLIDGVLEAQKKLEPAKLGVGWGYSRANINRRARDVDGKVRLGMNPDGPVDRRIGIIRIDRKNGEALAVVANYAIHGTVLGGANKLISGDVSGVVANYVEDTTGATLLFINGAAGNLAPIYSVYPNPDKAHLSQFRVLLGDKIIKASRAMSHLSGNVSLQMKELVVELPGKEGLHWPESLSHYVVTTDEGRPIVNMPVRFMKINGDTAIWSAPLELFCEISNEIRDRSPFAHTLYFGYTNGWFGYMLTESEYKQGGYEAGVSPFAPSAAQDLIDAVSAYLDGEMKE